MNDRPNILVAVDLSLCIDALDPLRKVGNVHYIQAPDATNVGAAISSCDAYMGHTDVQVTELLLASAPRVRVVCTCSTGTDHIDLDALQRRAIDLVSLTTEYALLERFTATAEMAWTLLQACRRNLPRLQRHAVEGHIGLPSDLTLPVQLSQSTLGVVGYGRLGRMVTEYGKAFRMRVLVCDPHKPVQTPGVEHVDFDTLLAESDFVSLHVHLRPDTHQMINRKTIEKMKSGVTIINVSRGDLVCEEALLEALIGGKVAAAGLDVVHDEWDSNLADRPLLVYARTHDNLILTPHAGGASLAGVTEARRFIAGKLAAYLSQRNGAL